MTIVIGACTSNSSTPVPKASYSAPASLTGTEVITGSTTSSAANPSFPLQASGLFTDIGTFTVTNDNKPQGTGTIPFSKGGIKFHHVKVGNGSQSLDAKTCAVKFTESGTVKALGGTKAYAGITGYGTYKVSFTGILPRIHGNGACNQAQNVNPVRGTQVLTFTVSGTFTLAAPVSSMASVKPVTCTFPAAKDRSQCS